MGGRHQIEVVGIRVDEGRKILLVKPVPAAASAASTSDQVDKFLVEALQNPRDRVTVLRLEDEIHRFLKRSDAQRLEFQAVGSSSSFFQLVAQRVAQHYGLDATVNGSKVCVTRAVDGGKVRQGGKRLADMVPKVADGSQPRVAIKKRGTAAAAAATSTSNGFKERMESRKSNAKAKVLDLEERKEEYSKARARIFHEESSSGSGDEDICCQIEVAKMSNEDVKDKETVTTTTTPATPATTTTTASGLRIFTTKDDKENVRRLFKEETSVKSKPSTPNRVAIIRDREKDRKDPDYDRSYDRYYLQRYDRGFAAPMAHPVVAPAYTTQFDACIQHPAAAAAAYSSWMAPLTPPQQPAYHLAACRGTSFAMDNATYSSYGAYPQPSQDARFYHDGFSSYSFPCSSSFQAFSVDASQQQQQQQYPIQMPVLPSYNAVNLHVAQQHY